MFSYDDYDKELFDTILFRFQEQYDLTIERPYHDGCTFIYKNGKELGVMNTDGYNLLANLTALCHIMKGELL